MRRKRPSRQTQSVALFPFLAVLICTFGVLIILLVIVVKAADQQADTARQSQEETHQELVTKHQNELELQEIRVAGIRSIRPDLVKKLKAGKSQRAHLQADIDRLSRELKSLAQQFEMLESPDLNADKPALLGKIESLRQQLADEKDLLEKKRGAAVANQETQYSIVPYDAPGGTARRPIYIECLGDEMVIRPYDIRLSTKDFVQPVLPNNPLDAALIAVREYFLQNDLDDETPYPLLIVRPKGAGTYVLARHAIKTWDEQFGYELIPEEMKLSFGSPDTQLKKQIELAVNAARKRQEDYVVQQQLQNAQRRSQVRQAGGGLQASGQFGGFVKPNGRVQQASGQQQSAVARQRESGSESGETASGAKRQADIEVAGIDSDGSKASIADDKGKNWALPSSTEGAIAYRRPVRIFLSPEAIVMQSDSRSNRQIVVSLADSRSAIEELVQAIWKRMDTWGIAGTGGYWKPELNIVVMPGAESRFIEIQQLLAGSGIEMRENRP